ncbi:MAG: hypothetical protein IJZ08_07575 [Clostridia bacterium]|nr:hypothetical protein [Clostridia bacterium]
MKKWIALSLALVLIASFLVSCGTLLNGSYSAEVLGSKMTYTFTGNKVTLTVSVLGTQIASIDGTYKIKGSSITLTFGGDEAEAKQYSGSYDFIKNDDSIKIGLVEYKKQ